MFLILHKAHSAAGSHVQQQKQPVKTKVLMTSGWQGDCCLVGPGHSSVMMLSIVELEMTALVHTSFNNEWNLTWKRTLTEISADISVSVCNKGFSVVPPCRSCQGWVLHEFCSTHFWHKRVIPPWRNSWFRPRLLKGLKECRAAQREEKPGLM